METERQPAPEAPGSLPEIPGFTLRGVLGRGGMGVVYRAEQHSPRREVAVKLLGAGAATPERLAAFRREAEVIARLEHPSIVPLYAFGEHQGQPYLALRLLRGGSAGDRLARGPLEISTALGWVREAAGALDFAHRRGLVHRDVKPSNILLDEAGHAYLSDFGIAGTLADTEGAQTAGSAAYMPPEQGRGEAVDHRADIYALAVTAFELLTGQKPYTAETALGVIVRHIHDPIPSARALNPAIPEHVEAALRRGMAKAAGERQPSAGEFARELLGDGAPRQQEIETQLAPELALPAGATVLEPGPPPGAVRPAAKRGPAIWLWVAGLLVILCLGVLLLGGGAGAAALLWGAPSAAPPTATPRAAVTPAASAPAWLLADDFSEAGSGFLTGEDEDGGVAYVEGALRVTVLTDGVEWRTPSRRVSAGDVRVDVSVRQVAGPGRNEIGVLCRWQDGNNYVALAVSAEGQAAIWRRQAGETEVLAEWEEAPGVNLGRGGALLLRATCAGSSLRLEANGQVVAEAVDPAPADGDVGVLAGLREAGELIVEFDDLLVAAVQ